MTLLICGVAEPLKTELRSRFPNAEFADEMPDSGHWDVIVHDPMGGQLSPSPATADLLLRATWSVWTALTSLRPTRYVQLSELALFDSYSPGWQIHEKWAPRPTPEQVPRHLSELTAREISRDVAVQVVVLRMATITEGSPGWEEINIADAAWAVSRAVEIRDEKSFQVLHIAPGQGRYPLVRAGQPPFKFVPSHPAESRATETPCWPTEPGPVELSGRVEAVAVFGASGPVGAVTATELASRGLVVRQLAIELITSRPIREPQAPGAPLALALEPPHSQEICDVTDFDSVVRGMDGCDVVVNLAVVRDDPFLAFNVNLIGTWNVMTAAHQLGVGKVVLGGPAQNLQDHPVGYAEDIEVRPDVPPRAGARVYFLTQLLAQEAARILAHHWQIMCPILLFTMLIDPKVQVENVAEQTFVVSWRDAARAMGDAVEVRRLPVPAPRMDIMAPGPQGRWAPSMATELLGWHAHDQLEKLWRRRASHPRESL